MQPAHCVGGQRNEPQDGRATDQAGRALCLVTRETDIHGGFVEAKAGVRVRRQVHDSPAERHVHLEAMERDRSSHALPGDGDVRGERDRHRRHDACGDDGRDKGPSGGGPAGETEGREAHGGQSSEGGKGQKWRESR
jgi:hypothetical protein